MRRWRFVTRHPVDDDPYAEVVRDDEGAYVIYEDVKELERQRDELLQALIHLEQAYDVLHSPQHRLDARANALAVIKAIEGTK